jgi:hypothetical protein
VPGRPPHQSYQRALSHQGKPSLAGHPILIPRGGPRPWGSYQRWTAERCAIPHRRRPCRSVNGTGMGVNHTPSSPAGAPHDRGLRMTVGHDRGQGSEWQALDQFAVGRRDLVGPLLAEQADRWHRPHLPAAAASVAGTPPSINSLRRLVNRGVGEPLSPWRPPQVRQPRRWPTTSGAWSPVASGARLASDRGGPASLALRGRE